MIKQTKIKNGLRVVLAPMKGTSTVTIFLMFKTGSRYETKESSGLSHFLEHMFFKGTVIRPTTRDIAATLDAVGGEYNAMTSKEYTGYYAKLQAEKIDLALDLISDIIMNSKFDSEEIDRERGVIVEELNMYEDNPMMNIEDFFEGLLYGDTPAGRDTIGTKKNILSFKRNDFVSYMTSQYGANNAILCVAGNLPSLILKKIEKYFQNMFQAKPTKMDTLVENQKAPAIRFKKKSSDQVTLSLGVRAFGIGHRDEFALRILSVILGGSMSSRLFTELRERRGLCYHVHATTELYKDHGYLTTIAGVRTVDLDQAVTTILKEYEKIRDIDINDLQFLSELRQAKDMISGRVSLEMESSDSVASWYARQAVVRGKNIIDPNELKRRNEAVTIADIRRVARTIFVDGGLNLAVIGPKNENLKLKRILKFS